MIFKFKERPLTWMFWHPHQKLWNWNLVAAIEKLFPIAPANKILIDILRMIKINIIDLALWK